MLYGTEFKYLVIIRADYDAAGMLSGGTLYSRAMRSQSVCFIFVNGYAPLFEVLHNVTESGLIGYCAYCTCLEYILFTEDLAYVAVSHRLIFSCEIKVDIRLLVSVETQEGGERNGESVPLHIRSAYRALLRRHINAAVVEALIAPFKVFALRAKIMWFQRIYLRYTGHCGRK